MLPPTTYMYLETSLGYSGTTQSYTGQQVEQLISIISDTASARGGSDGVIVTCFSRYPRGFVKRDKTVKGSWMGDERGGN